MVSPIDYTIDVASPFQTAMQGWEAGTRDKLARAEESRRQQIFDQQQAAQQQQLLQKQVRDEALYNFSIIPNKTAEDYSNVITRFPDLAEPYQKSWEMMDSGRQQQTLSTSSQVYAALRSNQPQVAKDILDKQAKAYENSGFKKEAFNLRNIGKMVETNPEGAASSLGMLMSSVNPEKFKDILSTLGSENRAEQIQPYQIAKTEAETGKITAETEDIPLAAQDRQQGVVNQGNKIEYDNQYSYDKLAQDNVQFFEGLNNQQKIEANKLKAAKVESSTQKMERLEKSQNFSAAAVNAASTAKLAAELINDYKKLSDASGAGVWNAAMRNVPGTAEYNFSKRVDTLKSQAFLIGAQNLKGLGAMTEMEGKKVTDALGNLDLSQSTKQVAEQLAAIARAANSVAQNSSKNAQIYATKGQGYSLGIREAAKQLGISEAEAQKFANESGL